MNDMPGSCEPDTYNAQVMLTKMLLNEADLLPACLISFTDLNIPDHLATTHEKNPRYLIVRLDTESELVSVDIQFLRDMSDAIPLIHIFTQVEHAECADFQALLRMCSTLLVIIEYTDKRIAFEVNIKEHTILSASILNDNAITTIHRS